MHGGTSSLMYLGGSDMNTSSQQVDVGDSHVQRNHLVDSKNYKADMSREMKCTTSALNSDNSDGGPN